MIDIKAIRAAAENHIKWEATYLRASRQGINSSTVITLCDEIERLRKDAERYQHIAAELYHDGYAWWTEDICIIESEHSTEHPTKDMVDAAIDAAMEASK